VQFANQALAPLKSQYGGARAKVLLTAFGYFYLCAWAENIAHGAMYSYYKSGEQNISPGTSRLSRLSSGLKLK